MRPMFEERHMVVMKRRQMLALIGGRARKEDQVMRTFNNIHRIKLHKAKPPDKRERGGSVMRVRCGEGQRVMIEDKAARILIAKHEFSHARGSYTYSSFSPSASANITA